MSRVLAGVLMVSLVNPSVALAGETLLASATRLAREVVATEASRPQNAVAGKQIAPAVAIGEKRKASRYQDTPRGLEASGLGRRSKVLIALGIAASFVGVAMAIDSRVEDNTPSTKGERRNEPF